MSIRHPLILQALQGRPWAATPAAIDAIARTLHAHQHGRMIPSAVLAESIPAATETPKVASPGYARFALDPVRGSSKAVLAQPDQKAVAVIPVHGVIAKYLSGMEADCGGFDLRSFDRALERAAADETVTDIVLHHHSPGGTVDGVQGSSGMIAQVAASKPVYSWTDSQMCSADYWMAAGSTAIFASSLAAVGSIGVYMAWIDPSRWMDANGYDLRLFRSGDLKAMTMPGQLDEAAAAHLQQEVDEIGVAFRSWVSQCRADAEHKLDPKAMQGQSMSGAVALQAGLIDGIYPTLNDLLAELLTA